MLPQEDTRREKPLGCGTEVAGAADFTGEFMCVMLPAHAQFDKKTLPGTHHLQFSQFSVIEPRFYGVL